MILLPILKFLNSEVIILPVMSMICNAAFSFCVQLYTNETRSCDAFLMNDNALVLFDKELTLNNSVENFQVVKL